MKTSIAFVFCFLTLVNGAPCPFAKTCDCDEVRQGVIVVKCDDVTEDNFPTFTASQIALREITINGNYTTVPNKAFYNLGVDIQRLTFQRYGNKTLSFEFNDGALTQKGDHTIQEVYLYDFEDLPTIPKYLDQANGMTKLAINDCGIEIISNGSLDGLDKLQFLSLDFNKIKFIEKGAFDDLNDTLVTLTLEGNFLDEVYEAILSLSQLENLWIGSNNITEIGPNAFPPSLTILELSRSPLTMVDSEAFGGLSKLRALYLDQCHLNSVPPFSHTMESLQLLLLNDNNITNITEDSFPAAVFMNMVNMPDLTNNPIEEINKNAFSAFVNVTSVGFTNLFELKTIDFDIFTPMKSLAVVIFDYCRKLQNVILTRTPPDDALPESLVVVEIANSDRIENVEPKFGEWLARSSDKVLDLEKNGFECDDDMEWMNEFVYCSFHPQIRVDGSVCDKTRVPLAGFLYTLNRTCES